jgi:hypothetical protein
VLLTSYGVFCGHGGIRSAAALLDKQIGRMNHNCRTKMTQREIGFLEWTAEGARAQIEDGADSYLIRDGLIEIMTIHYTVKEKPGRVPA